MANNFTIGPEGLDLIKDSEGLRLKAYFCPAGVLTIGWGHTKTVKPNQVITLAEAENLLRQDVKWAQNAVNRMVSKPLNQNQFDALVSWVINFGESKFRTSTLLAKINAGDFSGAQKEFGKWIYSKGKKEKGLVIRRAREAELFGRV